MKWLKLKVPKIQKSLSIVLAMVVHSACLWTGQASANSNEVLRIFMLSPEVGGAAGNEIVGIVNPTDHVVSLSAVVLEYQSATGTSWSKKLTLVGELNAGSDLTLASSAMPVAAGRPTFTAGFALAGGRVRLRDSAISLVYDQIGWGTASLDAYRHVNGFDGQKVGLETSRTICGTDHLVASEFKNVSYPVLPLNCPVVAQQVVPEPVVETLPVDIAPVVVQPEVLAQASEPSAPVVISQPVIESLPSAIAPAVDPTPAQSEVVTPSESVDVVAVETVEIHTTPVTSDPITVDLQSLPIVLTSETSAPIPADAPVVQPVVLNEIYPNPGAGELDSQDEFVEFYNPNDIVISMKDYELVVGSKSVDISAITVPANGYSVVKSADTALSLSNAGSTIKLTNSSTKTVDNTTYASADPGLSYSHVDNEWRWSTTVTPASVNEFTNSAAQILGVTKVASVTKSDSKVVTPKVVASKPSTTKSTSVVSAAKASTKTSVAGSTTKTSSQKSSDSNTKSAAKQASTKPTSYEDVKVPVAAKSGYYWLVVGLIGLVGYAIWEYRYEIRNYYQKLRGNRSIRPQASPEF
jgi:hypothetical protein